MQNNMQNKKDIKILLVEDNQIFINVAKEILCDYTLYIAKTLHDSFIEYNKNNPSIVLIDISLPDGSGHELLKYIRKQDQNCNVIMLTSSRLDEDRTSSINAGASGYIVKPYSEKMIMESIDKYIKNLPQLVVSNRF